MSAADVERVREVAAEIGAINGAEQVLSGVARGAAHLCHAELAAITMLMEDRDRLALVNVFGTSGVIVEKPLPLGQSLNGMVVTSGRGFRSSDLGHDRRRIPRVIARRNRVRSVLIVPLGARERAIGTIAVARRTPSNFTAQDQAVLEDLAAIAGIVLENAHLRVELPKVWQNRSVERVMGDGFDPPQRPGVFERDRLTPRERDIVALLKADRTCKEVALSLGLSAHTVRHYLERLKLRFRQTTLHGLVGMLGDLVPPAQVGQTQRISTLLNGRRAPR